MKLTPLARRNRSSARDNPSITLGVLTASSEPKNHWFARGDLGARGLDCAGDGALLRDCGRGGEVLELYVGGDGTAGGISRRRDGDFEVRSTGGGFGGSDGG